MASNLFPPKNCLSICYIYMRFQLDECIRSQWIAKEGGNLMGKMMNDGIVGLRLLLVPSVVSIFWYVLGSGLDTSLGYATMLCVLVGSCRSRYNQGSKALFFQ